MTTPQSRRHERHFLSPDQESPQRRPKGRRLGLGLLMAGLARSTSIPLRVALTFGLALAWPALGSAATCTVSPANPTINMGQSVSWTSSRSGFPSGTYVYAWTFPGGNPATSTSSSRSVSYANAGTSTTSLKVTRGGTSATCTSTVTVRDTQAPTVPGNFTATAAGATQINLAWSASTDNVGVTGYRLERCTGSSCTSFSQIATPTTTSYSDTGRTANTTYRYRVRAVDAAGNRSAYSSIRNATTSATALPTLSLANVSQAEGNSGTSVMTFTATLSAAAPTGGVTFSFATANGTATAGSDYVAASGSRTIAAGATTATVPVTINGDTAVEADETLTVGITGATNTSNTTASATGTITNDDGAAACNPTNLTTSINSTSQSGCPGDPVPQQAKVANTTYSVLAINDLGMHCGDLDTRISSILPPFQVLLAQVIQKGTTPVLNPTGVSLAYSAAANPNDPILSQTAFDGVKSDGSTYKTNFWDGVANGTYDPFYPGGLGLTPLDIGGFPVTADKGLPVPNVEDLYIGADGAVNSGDEQLTAVQHAMPGLTNRYVVNTPQAVQEHYLDKPFFVNFPFGYVAADVNWFEGAGVPFVSYDDLGRENAYPLVRVQAKNTAGTVLSTVDTVLPISGEASCTNCHSTNTDYASVHGVANRTDIPTNLLSTAGLPVATSLDDPDNTMPAMVSLEYAADINVLRLHDLQHGARYVSTACDNVPANENCLTTAPAPCTIDAANPNGADANCLTYKALQLNQPAVCQTCHYTPALDLAQVGPKAGAVGTEANGRNQLAHQSNSRVMHNNHGAITALDRNGIAMFPAIPAPIQDATGVTNQTARSTALDNSCYQCHPGSTVKCERGAMFNGDMLCSDCHGTMLQIGNDFSKNVSPTAPGAFILAKDFYTNADTPRVPWANEPGCGSCHTGDAATRLTTGTGLIVNTVDSTGNTDGIRLRQAFRTGDAKATPIIPSNKRFAEPVVPASFGSFTNPGAGNPQLYRVSTGHGGVMCEGCHGATHAEWPNANPNGNDNVTANQLQGHTGVIGECTTCHGTTSQGNTLNGPHGMHPVGSNTSFANGGHENAVSGNNCVVCHGANATESGRRQNTGTVLSRAFAARTLEGTAVAKGEVVGCNTCHD
ncbi:MAG: Calx-beta domain-containing protein [Chromatiaceae bacterium]